jgi:cysteine desulfuration protein SufE
MTINELQNEIIEEFELFDDWLERYQLIIDYGKQLKPMPEADKNDQNLIDGCQSTVWFTCRVEEGKLFFTGDSDAILVKGIVALLLQVLSGQTPQDIIEADLYFIDRIGLREHLSPTRSNGLLAMVKQIKAYAVAYGNLPLAPSQGRGTVDAN